VSTSRTRRARAASSSVSGSLTMLSTLRRRRDWRRSCTTTRRSPGRPERPHNPPAAPFVRAVCARHSGPRTLRPGRS